MAGKTATLFGIALPSAVAVAADYVRTSLRDWAVSELVDPIYDHLPEYIRWALSFDLNLGILIGISIAIGYLKARKIIPAIRLKQRDRKKVSEWRTLVSDTYRKASCGVSVREALGRDKRFDSLKAILSSDDLYLVNTTFVSVRAFMPGQPPPSVPDEAKILPALDLAIDRAERMIGTKKGIQKLT